MEILSVYDSAFKPYGRVVEGYPTEGLVKALATTSGGVGLKRLLGRRRLAVARAR